MNDAGIAQLGAMEVNMQKTGLGIVLGLLLTLAGCVPSLHPLYNEKDVVAEPGIVGTWTQENGKDTWTFQKSEEDHYKVVYTESGQSGKFEVHLVKLGKFLFADFYPEEPEIGNGFYRGHLLPVHTFARVRLEGDKLQLSMLDPDWLKEMIQQKKVRIPHEVLNDEDFVLTAATEELQKLVQTYAEDPKAFSNDSAWLRKK
jgi:hypothetical protein